MRLNNGDRVNIFNGMDGEWESNIDLSKGFILICKKIKAHKPIVMDHLYTLH